MEVWQHMELTDTNKPYGLANFFLFSLYLVTFSIENIIRLLIFKSITVRKVMVVLIALMTGA